MTPSPAHSPRAPAPLPASRPSLRELLRPLPTVQAPFTPQSLATSVQGWATLVRDGDIVEVRPGFAVGPGTVITAALRALSLADLVPTGVVVGRASAAWVHTGLGGGRRVCVLYAPGRHRPRDVGRLEVCQASVRPWEIDAFPATASTIEVTTLARTAMDVATWCSPQESADLLAHLVTAGLDIDEALHRLDLVASWRGAETARTRLLAARAQAASRR